MRHAVLVGGKRIRPRLLLAVAVACHDGPLDDDSADLAVRAATAVELIHAASLVHDDLPCFDDAELRRGKQTVHCAFGEPMAVLTGDALITLAFEILAQYEGAHTRRALRLVQLLSEATGSANGIIGGQSLELPVPGMQAGGTAGFSVEFVQYYHEMKTAALFRYATRAAAVAAGASRGDQEQWGRVGTNLGLAFQLIDDLLDLHSSDEDAGKTTGRDQALGRPNGALVQGSNQAVVRLSRLIDDSCGLVMQLAKKPDPVMKLFASFDAMLCKLGNVPEAGESGIFAAGVASSADVA